MELRKLVYQLWRELEGMNITDDTLYNYEYLKDKIIAMHPSIIKEAESQFLPLNGFYQTCSCIEVKCVSQVCTIEGIPFVEDVDIYTAKLPPLVKTIGRKNLRYFGIVGYAKDIEIVGMENWRSSFGARFTAREPKAMILGDTAVIKNLPTTGFRMATISAILSDPTKICEWPEDDMEEFPTASVPRLMIAVKRDILSAIGRPDLIHDSQIAVNLPQQRQQSNTEEE